MIDLKFLKQFELTNFDLKALQALIKLKSAKASELCQVGNIPSSKIYISLTKLSQIGVVEEVSSRPKMYSLVPNPELFYKLEQLNQERNQEFRQGLQALQKEISELDSKSHAQPVRLGVASSFEDYRDKYLSRLAVAGGKIYSYINLGDNYREAAEAFFSVLKQKSDPNAEHIVLVTIIAGSDDLGQKSWLAGMDMQYRVTTSELGTNFHFWDGNKALQTLGNNLTGIVGSYYTEDEHNYNLLWEGFMAEWYQAEATN